jgi:hypothetical protein
MDKPSSGSLFYCANMGEGRDTVHESDTYKQLKSEERKNPENYQRSGL